MWLPTTYMTLRGMTEYGFHEEAHRAAVAVLDYMWKTYESYEPHSIWEAYAPEGYRPATCTDDVRIVRKDFCGWSALGPISIYLEYVLGFSSIDAFNRVVHWHKPDGFRGQIGVRNLRFGEIQTDIIADGKRCRVISNAPYTLKIGERSFEIRAGGIEILL